MNTQLLVRSADFGRRADLLEVNKQAGHLRTLRPDWRKRARPHQGRFCRTGPRGWPRELANLWQAEERVRRRWIVECARRRRLACALAHQANLPRSDSSSSSNNNNINNKRSPKASLVRRRRRPNRQHQPANFCACSLLACPKPANELLRTSLFCRPSRPGSHSRSH